MPVITFVHVGVINELTMLVPICSRITNAITTKTTKPALASIELLSLKLSVVAVAAEVKLDMSGMAGTSGMEGIDGNSGVLIPRSKGSVFDPTESEDEDKNDIRIQRIYKKKSKLSVFMFCNSYSIKKIYHFEYGINFILKPSTTDTTTTKNHPNHHQHDNHPTKNLVYA